MEHTPGPWIVEKWYGLPEPGYIDIIDIRSVEPDASGLQRLIARIAGRWNMKYGKDSAGEIAPMQRADARLIASAPDLLEIVLELREYDRDRDLWGINDKIDAAIAKATNDA